MRIIYGPRRSGKTTKLIGLCLADPNGVLVTPNARQIERDYPELRDRIYTSIDAALLRHRKSFLYIDEYTAYNRTDHYWPVEAITITTYDDLNEVEV